MSQTGPLGHSPVNLSTSMGLSDPRLRRALQLSQVMEQKLGFGLKLDKDGRLAVDSKTLASDSTTINTLLNTLISYSSSSTTNNSFITNEFDPDVLPGLMNELVANTPTGVLADFLEEVVGPGDWPSAPSESIASYVLGLPRYRWTIVVETDGAKFYRTNTGAYQEFTHSHSIQVGGGAARDLIAHVSFTIVGQNSLGAGDQKGVGLRVRCLNAAGAEIYHSERYVLGNIVIGSGHHFIYVGNYGNFLYVAKEYDRLELDGDIAGYFEYIGSSFGHSETLAALVYKEVPSGTVTVEIVWFTSTGTGGDQADYLEVDIGSQVEYLEASVFRPGN